MVEGAPGHTSRRLIRRRAGVGADEPAHLRAVALGRQLVVRDDVGPVTATLEALALVEELCVVQVSLDEAAQATG